MNVMGSTKVTYSAKERAAVSAAYDPALQMTRLVTTMGDSTIETWLPTHQLADLLASCFDAAASDTSSIGYDTWAARQPQLNPRLAPVIMGTCGT